MNGLLFVVSAPSGAGKTSLVKALLEADADLTVAVSHTTRPRRSKEIQGLNYHFTDPEVFAEMVDAGAFLEHALVFDNRYGTSRSAVDAVHTTGKDVILEIDWQGAAQIRETFAQAVSIFILPPSLAALRERLEHRAEDDERVIRRRLREARAEISHAHEFTHIIVNDVFDTALASLRRIIAGERDGHRVQTKRHADLIQDLLKGA